MNDTEVLPLDIDELIGDTSPIDDDEIKIPPLICKIPSIKEINAKVKSLENEMNTLLDSNLKIS